MIFHEVMNLQGFKFDERGDILANVQNISPLFFLHTSVNLWRVILWQRFMAFFIIFHKVIKLQSFAWLDEAWNYYKD